MLFKKKKRVQEEGDQENKKVKQKGNEKGGECETWWTKTRKWWKKDGRKTCKKEKHKTCFVSREIHFKNTDEFFFKKGKKELARI